MTTRIISLVATLALTACDQSQNTPKIVTLEEKFSAMEQRLATQETQYTSLLDVLAKSEKNVNDRLTFLSQEPYREKTVILDPNSKGYASLATDRGPLLFSCDGAEPYLDGHRINIRIGNPLYMKFSGFKLKFTFGRKLSDMPTKDNTPEADLPAAFKKWLTEEREPWLASLRKSEESFTEDLNPGAWTAVQATLPKTKPEDIAMIQVSIETNNISLLKAPTKP
jgi:hypothetical protein